MRLFPVAASLFILVPLIEIYLFIEVGSRIGALNTVLLVLFTAIAGVALLRRQGLSTMQNVQRQMQAGEVPAVGMLEGMLLFFAGALLLTPGFFTDSIGLLLMIPPLRKAIALWVLERSGWIVQVHTPGDRRHGAPDDSHIIEGEYKRQDRDNQ